MTIYQAITTKYAGPTNTKGGRIIATTESGIRHTISYPHELTIEQGHRKAAEELAAKLKWPGKLVAGGLKRGYAFVMLDDDN
jgi:hypothetical protein